MQKIPSKSKNKLSQGAPQSSNAGSPNKSTGKSAQ